MVEENLMHRDASDFQAFEDLLTADASLRALARQLTTETESGARIEPTGLVETITKCRTLLAPAIGKLREVLYSPPLHAKAKT